MNRHTKAISIILIMMYIFSISVYATDVTSPGSSASSKATMSQSTTIFNVTVPTSLPVTVDGDCNVIVSNTAKIVNNSFGPIKISSITLTPINDWSLVDFSSNFKSAKVGLKQFGFRLNDTDVPDTGLCNLSGFTTINGGLELPISYSANISIQNKAITTDMGTLVVTINWDEYEIPGSIASTSSIESYYVYTDDTLATGGWAVTLNPAFKTALQGNSGLGSNYLDWIAGTPLPNPGAIYQGKPVTSLYSLFKDCTLVKSLDLSNFDTINVKNMRLMFNGSTSLTSINLTSFNTSNVTDMVGMFQSLYAMTSIDLSILDTSNVKLMSYMFGGCTSLTSIDLSVLNLNHVTGMNYMFTSCTNLTNINLSNIETNSLTDTSFMFQNCSGLTSLDLSSLDTKYVTDMRSMFLGCYGLASLDLSTFDTSNLKNISSMFYNCTAITSINLNNWNTQNLIVMNNTFNNCNKITTLDLSSFNTGNVISMGSLFYNCKSLTSLDLSSFNTSKVTIMTSMFRCCNSINNIDLSTFDTSSVTSVINMFTECYALSTIYVHTQADKDKLMLSGISAGILYLK